MSNSRIYVLLAFLSLAALTGCGGSGKTADDGIGGGLSIDRDFDQDGVADIDDNCPGVFNPNQEDSNGDDAGDACDDDDNDGVKNGIDNCRFISNSDQLDTDGDGLGDVCDGNGNGDGDDEAQELTIDPDSLRIEFVEGVSSLPGTGKSAISVRMLALRTDGTEKNIPPELVITDQVRWQLSGDLGSPAKAELDVFGDGHPRIRDTTEYGKLQDIFNRVQMGVNDPTINASVIGFFDDHEGFTHNKTLPFTVVPPTPNGSPKLEGDTQILLDPSIAGASEQSSYTLWQYFSNTENREPLTDSYFICSSDTALAEPSADQTGDAVAVTFKSPFSSAPDANNAERIVKLFAVDRNSNTECPDTAPGDAPSLDIKIKPGVFAKIDACVVINPVAAEGEQVCNDTGKLNAALVASCQGLDTSIVTVPAAQRLQFAVRRVYNDVQSPGQTLVDYQCSDNDQDVWSVREGDRIYFSNPMVDPKGGFATTADGVNYDVLKAEGGAALTSVVTAEFGSTSSLIDTIELNLVGPRVEGLKIERLDGVNNEDGAPADTLYINSFLDAPEYRALCKFSELAGGTGAFEACPNGLVKWTSTDETKALPEPGDEVVTQLAPQDGAEGGAFELKLSYLGSDEETSQSRQINAVDPGELTALRLFMVPDDTAPDTLRADDFACVGRDDQVQSLEEGEFVRGGQQFHAYAQFAGLQDNAELPTEGELLGAANTSTTRLMRVTDQSKVSFSAIPGFWSGVYQDPPGCQTAIAPGADPTPITDATGGYILTPGDGAASFADPAVEPENKGRLRADGLLRFSTVCVQAYADTGETDPFASSDGASVLVLPAADDDLLTYSEELCEVLDPVVYFGSFGGVSGGTAGFVLPVVYGISLVADPLLGSLIANDDGGTIPAEDIVSALLTGDFSSLSEEAPDLGAGLGDLTSVLLTGGDQLPAGLLAVVDVVDACALSPVITVGGDILNLLLDFDFEDFQNYGPSFYDDCINLFGGLGQ